MTDHANNDLRGRICLRCGHEESMAVPGGVHWCDQMIEGTGIVCCDGDCIYEGESGADDVELTDWPSVHPRV